MFERALESASQGSATEAQAEAQLFWIGTYHQVLHQDGKRVAVLSAAGRGAGHQGRRPAAAVVHRPVYWLLSTNTSTPRYRRA